jgi:quercetin dioxygenase-like cupin family protein
MTDLDIRSFMTTTAYKTPAQGQPKVNLFGPIALTLASAEQTNDQFCVYDSVLPAGVFVPLHSHPEVEHIYVLEGALEILAYNDKGHYWMEVAAGESVVIPTNARHALRNISTVNARLFLVSDARIGRFFDEIGVPVVPGVPPGPPTPEMLGTLLAVSARYEYWNASPEENAAIGINLF